MIRIIIRSVNCGTAEHVGGPVETSYHTIDIDAPDVEAFLKEPERMNDFHISREIIGSELLPDADKGEDLWRCTICESESNSSLTVQCGHSDAHIRKIRGFGAGKFADNGLLPRNEPT